MALYGMTPCRLVKVYVPLSCSELFPQPSRYVEGNKMALFFRRTSTDVFRSIRHSTRFSEDHKP